MIRVIQFDGHWSLNCEDPPGRVIRIGNTKRQWVGNITLPGFTAEQGDVVAEALRCALECVQ